MTPEEKKQIRLTPIFLVVAVVFGLVLVSIVHQVIQQCAVNQNWAITEGEVTRVSQDGWWNEKENRRYYLDYAYEVQGQTYEGYRYHLREKSLKGYGGIQYQYQVGDSIVVHFDPANPGSAVLNTEYLRDWFVSIIVLVGILVLSGMVFLKESNDQRVVAEVSASYDGSSPLPSIGGVKDGGGLLQLNTGMSLFWSMGIPFLGGCFIGITPLLFLTQEVNPGWGVEQYGAMGCGVWAGAFALGLVFNMGSSYTLEVDSLKQEIREIRRLGFGKSTETLPFDQVAELRLYREAWRHTNPLRNWILFVQGASGKSMTISRGYRDFQAAHEAYLGAVKARIEYLLRSFRA